ncbi:MAG: ABC transporter permease [Bacteroidetes bacterium]|nr:MAG: ABC transporter permease [Bacteroidota bacterium]
MLRNYFKIAWRNLLRNRSYSIINILGLTAGLACFMLIMLYVQDEVGYDSFHEKGDQIYRVGLERIYPGRTRHYAIIPHSYGAAMDEEYAEVEAACRLLYFPNNNTTLQIGEQLYEEEYIMWADSNFFDFFSIPLLLGDPSTCLTEPNQVILTESIAKRYFGDVNPIGKTIRVPQGQNNDLTVSGVCADVPVNSHLKFNILSSSASLPFLNQSNFIGFSAYTYLMLNSNADPLALEAKFDDLVIKHASGPALRQFGMSLEEYMEAGNGYRYFLQPLEGIYLDSNLESEIKPPGSRQRVNFFLLIAILIIGIAAINFMNLATARSAGRAREVGIRKTLGSTRNQIATQFLVEAVIISLSAGILAWGLNYLLLDQFNQLTGKSFEYSSLMTGKYILLLVGAAVATGLLSGIYPAFALSSFKPVQVLRGKFMSTSKGAGLRNALVVFQFGISVFLIISTILIHRQWVFTQNKSLGFDKESLVNLQGAGGLTAQQAETFKKQLRELPGVIAVSGCNSQPGDQYFGMSFIRPGANESTTGSGLIISDEYIECMKMEIVEGRSFSEKFQDSLSILINEAAVSEMGLDNPIGTTVVSPAQFLNPAEGDQLVYTIIGVVRDFHFQSLHHVISPLFLIHNRRSFNNGVDNMITLRLEASATTSTLAQIETMWNRYQPDTPFRYAFMDQDWAQLYEKEMTTRRVSSLFSLIAILIACLGLLALAAFTAERKTKEIGIRKVLGATIPNIIGMLSKDFLKLVIIGIVIASPVAWWVMDQWLQDFAYRIEISWGIFALAAVIAIAIAFTTVSFQSLRAAMANPIQSLRAE